MSLRLYFAGREEKKYFYGYSEIYPEENGIFVESGLGLETLIDLAGFSLETRKRDVHEVEVLCRSDSLAVRLDAATFEVKTLEPIQKGRFAVVSTHPDYFPFGLTYVDRMEVEAVRPDGSALTVAAGDLRRTSFFVDLTSSLGMAPDSRLFMFLALTLLVIAAFLFDSIPALCLGPASAFSVRLFGLLFLLLPLQGVLLLVLRACLALPFVCWLLCMFVLTVSKFFMVLSTGFLKPKPYTGGRRTGRSALLYIAGVAVYGMTVMMARTEWGGETGPPIPVADLLFAGPLLVLAGGVVLSRSFHGTACLVAVLQYFSYFLLVTVTADPGKVLFLMGVLLPWMVGTSVDVNQSPRLKAFLSQVFACAVLVLTLGGVEILMRGVPFLEHYLDSKPNTEQIWSDVESLPSLFEEAADAETLTFVGRVHKREKKPECTESFASAVRVPWGRTAPTGPGSAIRPSSSEFWKMRFPSMWK